MYISESDNIVYKFLLICSIENEQAVMEISLALSSDDYKHYIKTSQHDSPHKALINQLLMYACRYNNLPIVNYLLTSTELKEHADIDCNIDDTTPLYMACWKNNLEVVKYLTTSPNLTQHAALYEPSTDYFSIACVSGHLEILHFLDSLPNYRENIKKVDQSFIETVFLIVAADIHKNKSIIHYLIFDYEIEESILIKKELIKNKNREVRNMFSLRILNKDLGKTLEDKNFQRSKIKL